MTMNIACRMLKDRNSSHPPIAELSGLLLPCDQFESPFILHIQQIESKIERKFRADEKVSSTRERERERERALAQNQPIT